MKKKAAGSLSKSTTVQKKDLSLSSPGNEIEVTILLLTEDFLIHDINLSSSGALFNKKKRSLLGRSFLDLLNEQKINTKALLKACKLSQKSTFQIINLEHSGIKKWYLTTITALNNATSVHYVVSLMTIDHSYQSLKSYMDAIINNLPGAVYWKDLEGRYMGCNKFVAEMAGYKNPEEMLGKTDYEFCWQEFADDWRCLDNKVINENTTIQREEKVKLANGIIRTELTFKSPLKNERHEIVGIIGTSLDITERKEMEAGLHESQIAAESANVLKTNFIQNMQHDIRTPVSSIWAVLDNLVETRQTPDQDLLILLRNSAKQLLGICNEVIDFDRIERGDIPVLSKRMSIRQIISKIIELNQTAAFDRGLNLTSAVDEQVPRVVKGDEHRVSRILINLMGNALKFTPKGSIFLSASLIKANKKNYIIQFKLQDTGIGIPLEKQHTLYEKFNRLNPANQNAYNGSGLGLRIVKKYVDDLDGEINVESAPNQGTTFFIDIPFEKALVETIYEKSSLTIAGEAERKVCNRKASANTSSLPASYEGHNILLIEDNELAGKVGKMLLESIHCLVTIAVDVKSSIEMLKWLKFDLVISDIGLPDGTGIDVIQSIKKDTNSLNFTTPFVALTATADNDTIQKSQEAGFIQVLSKPLQAKEMRALIDKIAVEKEKYFLSNCENGHQLIGEGLPTRESDLFELDQYPLLDIAEGIAALGNESILFEMLTEMAFAIPKDREEIVQVYRANNWQRIEELAHRAKGGATYCGTLRLKYACQYLERYHKAGYSKLLKKLYQQLIKVLVETQQYLESWLKEECEQK